MSDRIENPDLRIDITSAALVKSDCSVWMREADTLMKQYNALLGVQIHNSALEEEYNTAIEAGYPLSFHSPVLGEYMMNFAAENPAVSWKMAAEQAEMMKKLQVKHSVFHAALMTDKDIYAFGHGMTYHECMRQSARPELLRDDCEFFVRDYTATDEYLMRRDRLKNNLKLLREKYPEFLWCVENDFPGHVAGVLRGSDLAYLDHPVCFDTGHMWATCKMLDLDFYQEMETAMASGNVKMIHLHASKHKFESPAATWGDGHLPLNYPTDMDIPRIIRSCRDNNVKHVVFEIADATIDDVKTVLRYYFEE